MPEDSGLPLDGDEGKRSTKWRWLGPWVLDSASFGSERAVAPGEPPINDDAWIYAFDWPRDGAGYAANAGPRSFVRCRRWVRPREPLDAAPPRAAADARLIPVDDPAKPPAASTLNLFS